MGFKTSIDQLEFIEYKLLNIYIYIVYGTCCCVLSTIWGYTPIEYSDVIYIYIVFGTCCCVLSTIWRYILERPLYILMLSQTSTETTVLSTTHPKQLKIRV